MSVFEKNLEKQHELSIEEYFVSIENKINIIHETQFYYSILFNYYRYRILSKILYGKKRKIYSHKKQMAKKQLVKLNIASPLTSNNVNNATSQIENCIYTNPKMLIEAIENLSKVLQEQPMAKRDFSPIYMREKQAAKDTLNYITNHAPNALLLSDRFTVIDYCMKNYFLKETNSDDLFLEFGVFSGKTINFISDNLPQQKIYGFDSFVGLPEDWHGYTSSRGQFNVDGKLPQVNSNIELIPGWFNETLPTFLEKHAQKVAFLHIDCDIYSSTKTIFENLGSQIKPGTIILFDEYFNYPNWQNHEYKAFQEFVHKNSLEYEYIAFGYWQAAIRIK